MNAGVAPGMTGELVLVAAGQMLMELVTVLFFGKIAWAGIC
jgi:hypothetical protein